MKEGWIKLSRAIVNTDGYFGEKFTRTMCWIDLLLLANWKDTTLYVRGNAVKVKRGQVAISLKKLAERWGLSINTVKARLLRMISDGQIDIQTSHVITIISIVNYDRYQTSDMQTDMQTDTQTDMQTDMQTDNIRRIVKNSKESKEDKEGYGGLSSAEKSADPAEPLKTTRETIDWEKFQTYFNGKIKGRLPQISLMSEARKTAVRARMAEFGKKAVYEVIEKTASSAFLAGGNDRNWRADFDWLFRPTNFLKVLEGNYDDKKPETGLKSPGNGKSGGGRKFYNDSVGEYTAEL